MDGPLEVLTSHLKSKANPITYTPQNIILDASHCYPSDTRIKLPNNQQLSLAQLWFILKNDDFSAYLKQCKEYNINSVTFPIFQSIKQHFKSELGQEIDSHLLVFGDDSTLQNIQSSSSSGGSGGVMSGSSTSGGILAGSTTLGSDLSSAVGGGALAMDQSTKKRDFNEASLSQGDQDRGNKKSKPFHMPFSSGAMSSTFEFGEKEKESKKEFIQFLTNLLPSDASTSMNVDAYLPYLIYDRSHVINYINSKEIPFSTRITQTQIEKEYVDKKNSSELVATNPNGSSKSSVSYFTNCLDNIKRCKEHFVHYKKEEQKKKKEREKKEKAQSYNQENVKLNYNVKGRFDERNVWQSEFGNEDILNDFQINTTGSMMMDASGSGVNGGNNSSNGGGVGLGGDLSTAAVSSTSSSTSALNQETNNTRSSQPSSEASSKQKPTTTDSKHASKKSLPIILLPPARSSLLTLYNVKDFLQKGTFITTEDKKKNLDPNLPKPKEVIIKHPKSNQQFLVLDTTKNFQKKDWDRVVAIFTIGQLWQFKDSNNWFSTDPSVIFAKKKGFTLVYDSDALAPNLQNWNLEKLYISKSETKRHTDSTVARKFWNAIGLE
ncbi:hypothetical protein FDP41_008432 [Naegleria fowleri]|uniref:Cell division control protein 73 C-terminal domain-containing protein n=1 Tax=Naegleria fowleri TaxID=5763 RepID=A0A6A5BGS7_NAEFO|nr:uncharacterized protein FDP41_008432 [Naegleria fowleri]KAF0973225.1 hypothetical protein FDP41_008432 [Naegleria fowleri]CAG4713028.1 unnamed protein product [Naegleria fowleri]